MKFSRPENQTAQPGGFYGKYSSGGWFMDITNKQGPNVFSRMYGRIWDKKNVLER